MFREKGVSGVLKEDMMVPLTVIEKADAATALAGLIATRDEIEIKKKEISSQLNGDIAKFDLEISELGRTITDGRMEEVDCQWRYDWDGGKKELVRLDTSEPVRSADITSEDRQMRL